MNQFKGFYKIFYSFIVFSYTNINQKNMYKNT